MKVVLEECGELYCPWDTFKEIALSSVDMSCIQEPLRSSVEGMYAEVTGTTGSNGGDDDETLDVWMVIALTVAACTVFFLLLQFYLFQLQKNKNTPQHDDKQRLTTE